MCDGLSVPNAFHFLNLAKFLAETADKVSTKPGKRSARVGFGPR